MRTPAAASDTAYKYFAFLSYSHDDTLTCQWLHRALETYRVPAALVGRKGAHGRVPERIYPVFRDRDELPSSSALNESLVAALRASRFMIVVCSPRAAASRWVNEEVRQFKALGGEERVLALIVDGTPNASDFPEAGLPECFPPALRYRIDSGGQLTGERVDPIAADMRSGKDGRASALLRLIAGILGVGFDELRQRDRQRRVRRRYAMAAAALAALALVGAGAERYAHYDRMRDFAERGRNELLAGNLARAAVYLSESYRLGNADEDLRFMLWQAMQDVEKLAATLTWPDVKIADAAFSPDGSLLAVSQIERAPERARTLVLDARTLRPVSSFVLEQRPNESTWPRFAASGEILFAAGSGWLGAWEARSGRSLWKADIPDQGPAARLRSAVLGDRVATGIESKVLIHDVKSGQLLQEIATDVPFFELAGNADGSRLLIVESQQYSSGFLGTRAWLWDIERAQRLRLPSTESEYVAFAFSPGGRRLALAHADGTIAIIDARTGLPTARVHDPMRIGAMAWMSDPPRLFAGGSGGLIYGWSPDDGRLASTLIGHTGPVSLLASVSRDRLLSASSDGTLRIWDAELNAPLAIYDARLGASPQSAVSVSSLAERALSIDGDGGSIRLWDLTKLRPRHRFAVGLPPNEAYVSEPARRIVLSTAAYASELWDYSRGAKVATLERGERAFRLSPDGSRLLTDRGVRALDDGRMLLDFNTRNFHEELMYPEWAYGADTVASYANGHLRVFDLARGTLRTDIHIGEPGYPVSVAPDGRFVALGMLNRAEVFDTASGRLLIAPEVGSGQRADPQFLADSRRMLVVDSPNVRIVDIATGKVLATYRHNSVDGSSWLQPFCNRKWAMVYVYSKSPEVISLESGQRVQTLRSPANVYLPDCDSAGRYVAAGAKDGFTRIWRISDGAMIAQFLSHPDGVLSAYFVDRDRTLVTAGRDRTVAVWQLGVETRDPATVSHVVACQAPWHLDGRELLPGAAGAEHCAAH